MARSFKINGPYFRKMPSISEAIFNSTRKQLIKSVSKGSRKFVKKRDQQWKEWLAKNPKPRWAHEYNANAHPMAPAANNGGEKWKTAAQAAVDSIYAVPTQNSANYPFWEEVNRVEAQLRAEHSERIKTYIFLRNQLEKAPAAVPASEDEDDNNNNNNNNNNNSKARVAEMRYHIQELSAELNDNELAAVEGLFEKRKANAAAAAARTGATAERLNNENQAEERHSHYGTAFTQKRALRREAEHQEELDAALRQVGGRSVARRSVAHRSSTRRNSRY